MNRPVLSDRRPRGWRSTWMVALALAAGALAMTACSTGSSGIPQCEDGLDNDSDGFTDLADFACQANPNAKESEDPPHACEDGIDNDGDSLIDFPNDPNCTDPLDQDEFGPVASACSDGIDNDGDTFIDFPDDPGCLVPNQNTEVDDCPDGPNCPECANGIDDDFDGNQDFVGNDEGCVNASDDSEFDLQPNACGTGVAIEVLPGPGTVNGTLPSANSQQASPTCGGSGGETAYVLMVPRPSTLVASTSGTTDTVVYVRRNCAMPGTELACNDNDTTAPMPTVNSKVTVDVQPGSYFIIVDGRGLATTGPFTLTTALYVGQGEECNGPADCAPGYTCRTVPGAPSMTCELPVCSDTRDDDGDGLTDFPADPGCTAPGDTTETDDCPDGPNCPDCGNQVDDDGDTLIDYPDDPSCSSASSASEDDCPIETDPITDITQAVTSGTTVGGSNTFATHTCQTASGPDKVHTLHVRAPLQQLVLDTSDINNVNTTTFDTVLAMFDPLCTTSLACDDDSGLPGTESRLTVNNVAVGTYSVVVDGFSGASGSYSLRTSGTYAVGAACDPLSPWFTCSAGEACTGMPGQATCQPAACNDNLDQDGDGFNGFPSDPGCTSTNDGDETDDCPNGPNCPQCGNDVDDDMDGATDYPMDTGCTSASVTSESCVTADPVRNLVTPTLTMQSTAALANDIDLSCGVDGRDEVFSIRVDHPIDMLRIDTIGSALDAVVAIKPPTCSLNDLVCDDNGGGGTAAQATLVNPTVGQYFVVVDDKGTANPGSYQLRVTGRYLDNGRCTPGGPFTCNAGFSCTGAAGAEVCTGAACNDTVDQDGDGFVGFPGDPGCTDTSDNDETDDCPNGPMCPACSNDLDDDMDTFTDYPADPACAAASGTSELAPCTSQDPVLVFQQNVLGATTAGRANDIDLTCGVDGRDEIYRILVTQPLVSLTADTFASDTPTALALRRGTCNGTTDLACGTNNFGTNDARVTINNVMPGEYFAIVDDLNIATPTLYNLNVSGVLPGGARCNPASTTFVCNTGFSCLGPAGAEVCSAGVCNDNVDSDGDGRVGFPDDPGCSSTADTDEADDCNLPNGPAGPNCPACANGLDDDNDGFIDYPNDIGCSSASRTLEIDCTAETDPLITVTTPLFMGTTAGAANDFAPAACGSTFTTTSPDRVHILNLPVPVTNLLIDTENSAFDTVLALTPAACTPVIECDDDDGVTGNNSLINRPNVAAGVYSIIVDGFSSGSGAYNLHVVGTVAAGTDCTHPHFAAGVLVCPAGTACTGGMCQ